MTPNKELQLWLAQQLPDDIQIFCLTESCGPDAGKITNANFQWKGATPRSILYHIPRAEWEYIVGLIEAKLTEAQREEHIAAMWRLEADQPDDAYYHWSDNQGLTTYCSRQTRAKALQKVLK
jgi:hypothetical protein